MTTAKFFCNELGNMIARDVRCVEGPMEAFDGQLRAFWWNIGIEVVGKGCEHAIALTHIL